MPSRAAATHPARRARALRCSPTAPPGTALLAALALLAGCGSTDNNITTKTPQQILQASKTAISKAQSVTIKHKGRALTAELQLTRNGGQGTIVYSGLHFQLIRIGETLYLKGSPLFYKYYRIPQSIPQDTWIKTRAGRFPAFAALAHVVDETARLIRTTGKITKGQTTTVEGQSALELKTEGKVYKGRLYIKTTGEPYPLKLEKTGRETSHTTFTSWNETPAPSPPSNTITLNG